MLPRQRFALMVGRALLAAGLAGLLPAGHRDEIDWAWWERLVGELAPHVGPIEHVAIRVPGNPRHSALLMAAEGRPVAFAKVLGVETSDLASQAWDLLGGRSHGGFRVPNLLGAGILDGVPYQVIEPLPEGTHHPPPSDPPRLRRGVDGFRASLERLPRPADTPAAYVPVHNDLTPRNLRVSGNGTWWLFDLDRIRFGPSLVDELRYWCAAFAYRRRPRVDRDAARILELLRERGTDEDIIAAVEWPGRPAHTYRDIEDAMRTTVGRLAREAQAIQSRA